MDTLHIINHMSSRVFLECDVIRILKQLFYCISSIILYINIETAVILMNVLRAFKIMTCESIAKNTWHQLQLITGVQHPDQRLMNYDQF